MISEPTAYLIGHTDLDEDALGILPPLDDHYTDFEMLNASGVDPTRTDITHVSAPAYIAELSGRSCYQSWDRPNPATRTPWDYLAHIIEVGHESVLAHAGATFYVTGVSRSLTHELVRHRFLGFSQLSQRYVGGGELDWVCPPAYLPKDHSGPRSILDREFARAVSTYTDFTNYGEAQGWSRKEARQSARAVLPNSTETRIVISGNYRAWRDFLAQRWTEHADVEIRRLAGALLEHLRRLAPEVFQDIPADYRLTGVPILEVGDRFLYDGKLHEVFMQYPPHDNRPGEHQFGIREVKS